MQIEVGSIIEGRVTGITNFGAFIELPEGKTGMVHISEIASTYVNQIRDFITENQNVKVKVLNITPEGKISLSIKRAVEQPEQHAPQQRQRSENKPYSNRKTNYRNTFEESKKKNEPMSFEDMLSKFKQTSDDKMSDLKRFMENKRGSANRRSQSR